MEAQHLSHAQMILGHIDRLNKRMTALEDSLANPGLKSQYDTSASTIPGSYNYNQPHAMTMVFNQLDEAQDILHQAFIGLVDQTAEFSRKVDGSG
jgi:hypothetical protein